MENQLLDKVEKVQIAELDSSKTYLLKLKFNTKVPKEEAQLIMQHYKKVFSLNNIENIIISYEAPDFKTEIIDVTAKKS